MPVISGLSEESVQIREIQSILDGFFVFRERKLPMEEKKELLDQDERVVEIELERLRGFVNHPFKVQADSQMIELQESIKKYGMDGDVVTKRRYP